MKTSFSPKFYIHSRELEWVIKLQYFFEASSAESYTATNDNTRDHLNNERSHYPGKEPREIRSSEVAARFSEE